MVIYTGGVGRVLAYRLPEGVLRNLQLVHPRRGSPSPKGGGLRVTLLGYQAEVPFFQAIV